MATERISYKQFDELLLQHGFSRERVEPKWLRYEHPASDTVIVLVEKKPNEFLRATDAVSARRHLVEKGLINAEEIEAMLFRKATLQETPSAKNR